MLKVTTWNVNGIRARQAEVVQWLERERPDVVCLQEVKAAPEQIPAPLCELGDYWCYWHGQKGYSGVALLLARASFPEAPSFAHPAFDHESRIVTARVGNLELASIYVPNGGKDFDAKVRFLDALAAHAEEAQRSGLQLILCGDLNVTREPRDVHPSLTKPNEIGQTQGEREQFARLLGHDLVDLSRKLHPDDDRLFTWWAPWRNLRQRNIGWRIDYVLASTALADRVVRCEAYREYGTSDHAPMIAELDLELPKAAGDTTTEAPTSNAVKKGQMALF